MPVGDAGGLIPRTRARTQTTGNGFVASWAGLVCAVAVATPLLPEKLRAMIMPSAGKSESAKVAPSSVKETPVVEETTTVEKIGAEPSQ